MKQNQILKIFGSDYKEMTKKILKESDLAGHIKDKEKRICIKPNMVVPTPAFMGATTHPEVVEGIVEYLRENDFLNIIIAESCWVGEVTSECFKETGFKDLCERLDIPFVDVSKTKSHSVSCKGMDIKVSDVLNDVDFLINVPVLKGHCQVRFTCALKNTKGLVPNDEKRRFHAIGINDPVGHLGCGIHQDFIVVDNICGDLEFEEGGNPFKRDCIMTALDPVLVDTYGLKILGLSLSDVPYIKLSESLGIGSCDLSKAEIISLNKGKFDEDYPKSSKVLDVSYAVEDLESCSACYANLIPALIRLNDEGLLEKLDTKIAIGQNHKEKTGKLGIGACTSGYDTCIMGCPPKTEDIYDKLKEYILKT